MNQTVLQHLELNGLPQGSSLSHLMEAGMDPGVLRPWRGPDGRGYVTVNTGRVDENGKPVYQNLLTNAPALLDRLDWLRIDQQVNWAAKQRLKLWSIIYGRNPYNVPNGMGTIAIQHKLATGDAAALLSMDPVRQSERTRATMDIGLLPLPVTHSDGSFTARELAVSRNGNLPLDTTGIELSARKIGEIIEQLSLGTFGTYSFNGGTIWGLTNHPDRTAFTLTAPTTGGWTPKMLVDQLLAAIKTMQNNFYYGPYVMLHSNGWLPYLGGDYTTTYAADTLQTRIEKIKQIEVIQNLDFLSDYQIILVQMTPDVVQGVQGMPITTVQWSEAGGMEVFFKVMCIQVPRVRSDYNHKTGIAHGVGA